MKILDWLTELRIGTRDVPVMRIVEEKPWSDDPADTRHLVTVELLYHGDQPLETGK